MTDAAAHGAADRLRERARDRLLSHWRDGAFRGQLSSSALSTATAVCALHLYQRDAAADATGRRSAAETAVERGLDWLKRTQNPDGGFGDTPDSRSNISTTTLCWVTLRLRAEGHPSALQGVERWLREQVGSLDRPVLSSALRARYGKDRTFSIPILTMCAIGDCLGDARTAWRSIPALPFELAAVPRGLLRVLQMPVVSYALPALIAIGQVRQHHAPTRNPVAALLRRLTRARTLRTLAAIQPQSGGFLEATPLTSFVSMSLLSMGLGAHPVVHRGIGFLLRSQDASGSWPIDTNLDTWTTTLGVNALAAGGLTERMGHERCQATREWLLGQQYREPHPYTGAAPGGFAWTDLSGGVPDADDSSGALLALFHLAEDPTLVEEQAPLHAAAVRGVHWLLDLQNRDGGIPTFCRGFGALAFDRSCADLTAHAMRAWTVWRSAMPPGVARRVDRALARAGRYLLATQSEEGCWVPLWFGHQDHAREENPLYGTTRVLAAMNGLPSPGEPERWLRAQQRALHWILSAQQASGGFGAAPGVSASIEETAMAVEVLATLGADLRGPTSEAALRRGIDWLWAATDHGKRFPAAPIGLYFARLWYSERLYPLLFTVSAMERWHGAARARAREPSRSGHPA